MDDEAIQRAIERARELHDRVRARVFARLAYPERIAELEAEERRQAPTDEELENLMWELDRRYREPLLGPGEI